MLARRRLSLQALAGTVGAGQIALHTAFSAFSAPAAHRTQTGIAAHAHHHTLNNTPDTRIPGSNVIEVTAPDGHVVSKGDVTVEGATLSIEADIDHDGVHTVDWRAVSADGHPIEGTFSFTYAPEGQGSESASATALASTPATESAQPSPAGT